MNRKSLVVLAGLCAAVGLYAQDTPETPQQAPQAGGRGGRGAAAAEPQPYDKVITKEAKTAKGLFTVHQVKEQYYYEIPKRELGKDFLWNSQIAKTTIGVGYGGGQFADLVVRWEQKGNHVLLEDVNFSVSADPKSPIAMAVKAANNDSILMSFPVAAFNKDGDPVIDVTRLFVPTAGGGAGGATEVAEISARQHLGASGVDAARSFIEHITPFPENVEAEVTVTYTNTAGRGAAAAGAGRGGGLGGGTMRGTTATVVLHHSMVKLPEKPMMPRLFDNRVGYFTTRTMDYTHDDYKADNVQYIARWRLEKKDPAAAVSDPVKPIVYYIDAATPTKWVPWLIKGVEDWNAAFREAGFSNAILAKKMPSAEEDPTWSPEDVRHSVIRWLPSTTENASGPHISDPRTGEILNADIQFYHNVMVLARDWYFTQVGPLDARAQKLPLPDELMGRLLEYVVCHEVGHTLGFQHNMKASSEYPFEKIRDAKWVHEMGHTPSIMDYSRFNYVAQPEDHIAVEDLVPRIGPYDIWATRWGYAPIPEARTADEERPTLHKWAKEQDDKPWLRFSTANAANSDPGDETEAVGDADAVKATALGVKNLQRVEKMLLSATAWKEGETYDDLSEMYGRMISQWQTEMNHVTQIVGGFNSQEKAIGQEGRIFSLVEKERQAEAVKFLVENAFTTPLWMVDEEILRRIEAVGVLDRIHNAQQSVLTSLLNSARFGRLVEQETLDGARAYSPVEFLATVRKGVWKELDNSQVKIDAYRRGLQRSYLTLVNAKVNPPPPPAETPAAGGGGGRGGRGGGTPGDEKPMYRAELRALKGAITAAIAKTTDHETRAHLEASRDEIDTILDPKFLPPAPATAAPAGGRGGAR
jgi:hypothetical protein